MRGFVQILLQNFTVFKGIGLKERRKEALFGELKECALGQLGALHMMGGCCIC